MRKALSECFKAIERAAVSQAPGALSCDFRDGQYSIRVAGDLESRRKAYALVYRVYLEKEYAQPNASGMWFSKFDALPETTTLLVERKCDGAAVGAATVVFDSPFGLPADTLYSNELDALRAAGRSLSEVVSLVVSEDAEGGMTVISQLFSGVSILAYEVGSSTDFVITVNPRHVRFYERMLLFSIAGPERSYDKVGGAPAVLLRLDFDDQRRTIALDRQALASGGQRTRTTYRAFPPEAGERELAAVIGETRRPMSAQEYDHFFRRLPAAVGRTRLESASASSASQEGRPW